MSGFVFASDVQGPISPGGHRVLIQERPTLLYLSGPPSYLERELGAAVVERGIENLLRVVDATGCRVIMDHYALRDTRFAERFARLWETGAVVTAAATWASTTRPFECRRHRAWAAARKPPARAGQSEGRAIIPARREGSRKGEPTREHGEQDSQRG